jgi:hypothetical protein
MPRQCAGVLQRRPSAAAGRRLAGRCEATSVVHPEPQCAGTRGRRQRGRFVGMAGHTGLLCDQVARQVMGLLGGPDHVQFAPGQQRRGAARRLFRYGQAQVRGEGRPPAQGAVDLHVTAHHLGQPARDDQPQAGAAVAPRGRRVALDEGLEQPRLGGRVHADAVVTHHDAQQQLPVDSAGVVQPHLHHAFMGQAAAELDGVEAEVVQHLAQAQRVAVHQGRQVGVDRQAQADARVLRQPVQQRPQVVDHVVEREVLGRQVQHLGFDLREVEDVVQQPQLRVRRFVDHARHLGLVGLQRGARQHVDHADHAIHRGADLVAHVGQELALGTAGGFGPVACGGELQRARLHLLLQVQAVTLQFGLRRLVRRDVDARPGNEAAARAVLHHQQPASVVQLLFDVLAAGGRVALQPLGHPGVDPSHGGDVLPAFGTGADDVFEAGARHDHVGAGGVHVAVGLVADDQVVVLVVDAEGHVQAFHRLFQQGALAAHGAVQPGDVALPPPQQPAHQPERGHHRHRSAQHAQGFQAPRGQHFSFVQVHHHQRRVAGGPAPRRQHLLAVGQRLAHAAVARVDHQAQAFGRQHDLARAVGVAAGGQQQAVEAQPLHTADGGVLGHAEAVGHEVGVQRGQQPQVALQAVDPAHHRHEPALVRRHRAGADGVQVAAGAWGPDVQRVAARSRCREEAVEVGLQADQGRARTGQHAALVVGQRDRPQEGQRPHGGAQCLGDAGASAFRAEVEGLRQVLRRDVQHQQ